MAGKTERRAFARRPRCGALLAIVLAGALAAGAANARAQESGPVQVRESDYPAYAKLRLAKAVAEEKEMFAHDRVKRAAIESEFARACTDLGWTADRYGEADGAVGSALSAIDDPENAGEEISPVTLATVKAHLAELKDADGLRQRARELMQEQLRAAARGATPTQAQLAGRWVWDIELTVAGMAEGMGDELKQTMREQLSKTLLASTYTFGPGDRLVAVIQRPGQAPETQQGTYRLNGYKLTVVTKMGSRERADDVDVGLKDGHLLVGMMGMYSVFRRE